MLSESTGPRASSKYPSLSSWDDARQTFDRRIAAGDAALEEASFRMEVLAHYAEKCPYPAGLKRTLAEVGDPRGGGHDRFLNSHILLRLGSWIDKYSDRACNLSRLIEASGARVVESAEEMKATLAAYRLDKLPARLGVARQAAAHPEVLGIMVRLFDWQVGVGDRVVLARDNRDAYRWLQKGSQEIREAVAKYAALLIDSLAVEVSYVPVALINKALVYAVKQVYHSETAPYRRLLAEGVACNVPQYVSKAEKFDEATGLPLKSPREDKKADAAVEPLDGLEEIERARICIAQERRISDYIRAKLIPWLRNYGGTWQEDYWAIHTARFEDSPPVAQNFGPTPHSISDYVKTVSREGSYEENVGRIRSLDVCSGKSFLHLPAGHLGVLEERFFTALRTAYRKLNENSADDLLDLITKAHLPMIVAHFPFDGSGRTNEDFLTYVAYRAGYKLTLQNSGYRHETSPLVEAMIEAELAFKHEVDLRALDSFGVLPGPYDSSTWMYNVRNLLGKLDCDANMALEVQKSLAVLRMIDALEQGSKGTSAIRELYPTFDGIRAVWAKALAEQYVSETCHAETLDRLVAESIVTAPFVFRTRLHAEYGYLRSDPLGSVVLDEYLSRRMTNFRSIKEQERFDDVCADIIKAA